jgi:hypothetical protein
LERYHSYLRHDPEFQKKTSEYRNSEIRRAARKQYYLDNIDYFKQAAKRHYNPGAKHGLSKEEYLAYMSPGRCAICGSDSKLKLDHNHTTGRIRGPLCHFCNVGIGSLKENPTIFLRASMYIQEPVLDLEEFDPVI